MFSKKFRANIFVVICFLTLLLVNGNKAFARLRLTNDNSQETVRVEQLISQQNFADVEIKTVPVRDNIYMLRGEGGNIGVIAGKDGALIIDSQYAELSTKIEQAVNDLNQQPITYLINTHYHLDHTGGNENMTALGVKIIAHDNVPKQMNLPHSYPVLGMEIPARAKQALPVMTFSNSLNLELNDNQIYAFHIPNAHTNGDVVIQIKDKNVIHTGDIYFQGMYPFIDTEVGGSVSGMISAIDEILPLCNQDSLIIPGHGNVSNCQELGEFQEMLKIVNQKVADGIEKGMSLEDLIAANILADLDAKWGQGFLNSQKFITIAYEGMKK